MKTSKVFLPLIALFFFIASSVSSFGQNANEQIPVEVWLPYTGHFDYWTVTLSPTGGGQTYVFNTTSQNNVSTNPAGRPLLGYIPSGTYTVAIQANTSCNWSTYSPVELTANSFNLPEDDWVYDRGSSEDAETGPLTVSSSSNGVYIVIDYLWY